MNIGEAAARAGLPPKTIRYYESVGLIGEPTRTVSGYRDYSEADVQHLRFLRRARTLGFSVEQCRELLALRGDNARASADVRVLAQRHMQEVTVRIRELEEMRSVLETLVDQCHGDDRPHCSILETLASPEGEPGTLPSLWQGGAPESPTDVVERYLTAFYRGDVAATRQLLANDFSYTAPGVRYDGADAFMKAAAHVAPGTRGYEVHKIFVDGNDVCVFYDLLHRHAVGSKPEHTAVDPVCKMRVDTASPPATHVHRGTTYFFCTPGCAEAFEKHPEDYLET